MLFEANVDEHHKVKRENVPSLNLGLVVALDILRAEVLQAHSGREGGTNCVQVGLQSDRLQSKSSKSK